MDTYLSRSFCHQVLLVLFEENIHCLEIIVAKICDIFVLSICLSDCLPVWCYIRSQSFRSKCVPIKAHDNPKLAIIFWIVAKIYIYYFQMLWLSYPGVYKTKLFWWNTCLTISMMRGKSQPFFPIPYIHRENITL